MALENVERSLTVTSDRATCWSVLTDVDLLASWVGIVHDVREIEHLTSYKAVLEDKVGPFKLRADLDVTVDVVAEGREITVSASGRDRAVDSKITIDATLVLNDAGEAGTEIDVKGRYQVTGKAASMGGGIIRKKGDRVVDDFFENATKRLNA